MANLIIVFVENSEVIKSRNSSMDMCFKMAISRSHWSSDKPIHLDCTLNADSIFEQSLFFHSFS